MSLDYQARLRMPLNAIVFAAAGLFSLSHTDNASANQLEIQATMPGDPGWGTMEPCKDSQFVVAGNDNRNMLLSRHTYCAKYVTDWQTVYMDVMKTADGKSYEPYKKSAGRPADTCTLGNVKLTTLFQAYGEGKTLLAPHRIKVTVTSFDKGQRTPNCPTQSSSIAVTPVMETGAINWTTGVTDIKVKHTPPKLAMQLTSGNNATSNVDGTVSWNSTEDKSLVWLFFRPYVYNYRVEGAEPADGVERYLQPGGSAGPVAAPTLRCDKKMLPGGSNEGCVFPDAAAVFVLDGAKWPESAQHAREAIAGTSVGMSGPAPGGFKLVNGTRAIGLNGEGSLPMQRANKAENTANREASCSGSNTSLIAQRKPINTSDSCEGSKPGNVVPGCSCDEYPFAATRSGGSFNPGATSAKYIQKTDNSGSGNALSSKMFIPERVLPYEVDDSEVFWVVVRN